MDTKTARRVLREYHAAVKALIASNKDPAVSTHAAMEKVEDILPQADLAVKALVERFP